MKRGFTLVQIAVGLMVLAIVPVLITVVIMWTDRNLDYLLTWIAGAPRNCPWWLSAIATVVGNALVMVFNIVMEILRFAR